MRIFLLGIAGTGVGALAGLLKLQGHDVSGCDTAIYPPMSDKLQQWGIPVLTGFDPNHLQPHPDLVVVGNVVRADNPMAKYIRAAELPHISMPQAVAEFGIRSRRSLVVAGTHGKTTTSALCAHLLRHAGLSPSFLIGGALRNFPESFGDANGDCFVVEGDEYDSAYFDKVPKFNHYRPHTAIIGNLEFDHADIYESVEDVEAGFWGLLGAISAGGSVVVWAGSPRAVALAERWQEKSRDARGNQTARIIYFDTKYSRDDLAVSFAQVTTTPEGLEFVPTIDGTSLGEMTCPLWGEVNARNIAAAIAAVLAHGVSPDQLRAGLSSFRGVKRRMEVIGKPGGITVVDDFAHHPTAVSLTLDAAARRWPGRRLWALFEPRSATTRRSVHQRDLEQALGKADRVIIAGNARLSELPKAERFDPSMVAVRLTESGVNARFIGKPEEICSHLVKHAGAGDIVLVLSNGGFGGLHKMLLRELK